MFSWLGDWFDWTLFIWSAKQSTVHCVVLVDWWPVLPILHFIKGAFNKQLVTLKFVTSAICFLLSGETIFFLKFKAVSNTPSRFVNFFWIQGRAINSKRGTSLVTDWCLKNRSATTRKVLIISWQYFGATTCYQQQEESRNCCKNCLGTYLLWS